MVNPVEYYLNTKAGKRLIIIEPVYEEITGRDLFSTGRYILIENDLEVGEIRFDGELFKYDLNQKNYFETEDIYHIIKFISEYIEPELAAYLDL